MVSRCFAPILGAMTATGATDRKTVRVALDTTPLLGPRTGIGRFVEGLVGSLMAQPTIEVVPFAMTARERSLAAPNQAWPLPARPMRAVWERGDWPTIERWTGTIDVVHGSNYIVPPTRSTTSGHTPRLVSVHDLTAIRYPEMCASDVVRMPILLRRALRSGAHVHTDSRFVASEVHSELDVPMERIHTIAPGVPIDPEALEHARNGPHPFGDRPFALALGTVEPRKDLPLLVRSFVQAAAELDDLTLVIAGADGWGSDALRSELADVPEEFRARIIRESHVDDDRRASLLTHAHFVVYPSRYEGFGFPPLEAMTAETPVIATLAGSLPEVLGDAAEFVPVDDVDALAQSMIGLRQNDQRRSELVELGTQQVARYSWATTGEQFAALYAQLASGQ
jgi:glycosyltransferase involved in cell wall biosynthesis